MHDHNFDKRCLASSEPGACAATAEHCRTFVQAIGVLRKEKGEE